MVTFYPLFSGGSVLATPVAADYQLIWRLRSAEETLLRCTYVFSGADYQKITRNLKHTHKSSKSHWTVWLFIIPERLHLKIHYTMDVYILRCVLSFLFKGCCLI